MDWRLPQAVGNQPMFQTMPAYDIYSQTCVSLDTRHMDDAWEFETEEYCLYTNIGNTIYCTYTKIGNNAYNHSRQTWLKQA